MGPKYEFTDETMNYEGHILHRIRRLSDGQLGGWIEQEENLSQEGNCWVDHKTKVFDDAYISDNAQVWGSAKVYGHSQIYGNAEIHGNTEVFDFAQVYGDARVFDNAKVYGFAEVHNNAQVYGQTKVYGHAEVFDNARVLDYAKVYDNAQVFGDALVSGNADVSCDAKVYGDAEVSSYIKITDGEYSSGKYYDDLSNKNSLNEDSLKEVVHDFIYKVDDLNKLTTQTEYDSIDEFFNKPITDDIKLDTLTICSVDTKEPLIKLQKVETDNKIKFKFIVDITNEDGDDFRFRTIIKSQEQLNQLIQQTSDALKLYPKFSKYANDLENCL